MLCRVYFCKQGIEAEHSDMFVEEIQTLAPTITCNSNNNNNVNFLRRGEKISTVGRCSLPLTYMYLVMFC